MGDGRDWGCASEVAHLPSKCEALGIEPVLKIASTLKKERKKERQEKRKRKFSLVPVSSF
jgi:hypothetical protein